MILIVCTHCKHALRVVGEPEELYPLLGPSSSFWPDKFACYHCEKQATGFLESELTISTAIEVKEVDGQEAFAAIHGLGLKEERDVDRLIVDALLREHPVRRVGGADIPGGMRVRIDYLELWDGTRLHFGSSNDGAVIYRITRPTSYVNKTESPK